MTAAAGPRDKAAGRLPALQQTRIEAFLISAHSAQARRLAMAAANPLADQAQIGLHVAVCREWEMLSLMTRAASWQLDPMLPFLLWRWELAWLPRLVKGVPDASHSPMIDAAAFGYALHTAIRPAAVLPRQSPADDPFAVALKQMELEGGRLVQMQLRFLKEPRFAPMRDAISAAVEERQSQIRRLWEEVTGATGPDRES